MGEVGILNVGAGDTKLVFDNKNPEETARAAKVVKDMIRRGFAILIEIGSDDKGPIYRRAHDFDENTHEYIIAGTPGELEPMDVKKSPTPSRRRSERKAKAQSRVPATKTNAVAVARVAGG